MIFLKKEQDRGDIQNPDLANFFLLYLLYFSKDPIARAIDKVNTHSELQELLVLEEEILTSQSFGRFFDWVSEGVLDRIFTKTVKLGLEKKVFTLEELITDSGPVEAFVNKQHALIFPQAFRRALFHLYKQLDFTLFQTLDRRVQGRRYSLEEKLKVYLSQILLGLGSLTQLYNFTEKYPDLLKIISPTGTIPDYQTMIEFINELHTNPVYSLALQALSDQLIELLTFLSPKTIPKKIDTLEDLFGTLGTKHSRVDRGARIGIKSKKGKSWYGYKDHVTSDAKTGLPVLVTTTAANVADSRDFKNHVQLMHQNYNDLIQLQTWTADKGYDAEDNRTEVIDLFGAQPRICKRNPSEEEKILQKEWNSHRQTVEHVISRAKEFGRKNHPRVRSRWKVDVWVKTSYFIVLSVGINLFLHGEPERIREISFYLS